MLSFSVLYTTTPALADADKTYTVSARVSGIVTNGRIVAIDVMRSKTGRAETIYRCIYLFF